MTIGNRRDFLRGSAAIGVLSASDAPAQTTTPTWLILLHSTIIEPELEEAFLAGLRSRHWEGDPTQPLAGNKPLNIRQTHGLGKYGATHPVALRTAAQALQDQTPSPKLIVAAGGNVTALAVNGVTFGIDYATKILALYGGKNNVEENTRATGINLGLPSPADATPPLQKIVEILTNPKQYNLPFSQLCLFYNGNSQLQQVNDWNTLTNRMGQSYDASSTDASGANGKIQFATAIDNALDRTPDDTKNRALVITSDPFFTIHRAKIIRRLKRKRNVIACFPFQEYVGDALEADFTKENCMAWGPILSDVYNTLGQTAGDILNGVVPQKVTGVKFVYFGKPPA